MSSATTSPCHLLITQEPPSTTSITVVVDTRGCGLVRTSADVTWCYNTLDHLIGMTISWWGYLHIGVCGCGLGTVQICSRCRTCFWDVQTRSHPFSIIIPPHTLLLKYGYFHNAHLIVSRGFIHVCLNFEKCVV